MQVEVQRVVGRESELAAIVEFLGWPSLQPRRKAAAAEKGNPWSDRFKQPSAGFPHIVTIILTERMSERMVPSL